MRYLPLLVLLFLTSCDNRTSAVSGPDRISQDREAKLKPVIAYVDGFIKDHNRVPTAEEFRAATASMDQILILRNRTDPYAASKGARTDLDYMVGIWRADWFHYYKSWDRSFLNGSDEKL
jgi:hypothetical protein